MGRTPVFKSGGKKTEAPLKWERIGMPRERCGTAAALTPALSRRRGRGGILPPCGFPAGYAIGGRRLRAAAR